MMRTVENNAEIDQEVLKEVVGISKDVLKSECLMIAKLFPFLHDYIFTQVSARLLKRFSYINADETIRLGCLVDLLIQSRNIVEKISKYGQRFDGFYEGLIITPDGHSEEIVIAPNNEGKLTIKLPNDL